MADVVDFQAVDNLKFDSYTLSFCWSFNILVFGEINELIKLPSAVGAECNTWMYLCPHYLKDWVGACIPDPFSTTPLLLQIGIKLLKCQYENLEWMRF